MTFGIEPASATGTDGRSELSYNATPGGVVFDHVALVNYSSVPLPLQVYATDAVETSTGGFGLLPGATKPTGVGSWVSIPPSDSTVEVPPETPTGPGTVIVPLTVRIPTDASPGDHVGGVLASLETVGTNKSGERIILDQRIGTRMFVRISGPLHPRLALTGLHAAYEGTLNPFGQGKVKVSYVLRNTGNVDLAVDQSVAVSPLVGSTRTVDMPKIPLLLPGASVSESAVVTGVWPQLVLDETVTAIPHALAGSTAPGAVTATASTELLAVPWTTAGVIVVVIGGGAFLPRRIRRRRARSRRGEEEHAEAKEPAEVGT